MLLCSFASCISAIRKVTGSMSHFEKSDVGFVNLVHRFTTICKSCVLHDNGTLKDFGDVKIFLVYLKFLEYITMREIIQCFSVVIP